ncbi:MAG: virulence-associated E family protein [Paenibacillaceae bacterium]
MINDRQITISAAGSRHAMNWQPQMLYWSELVERLRTAARGTETLQHYLALPKGQQDDLKDVGGFVAGNLSGRRKPNALTSRDVLTLDLDNIPAGGTDDVLRRLDGLGCGYTVYSTRKHEAARPRLRVLAPLDRTATADEYEPLARKLGAIIGIELCDPTTFQVTRLMYWPSCCADSTYVYHYGDKPFLSADGLLSLYTDWRNWQEWPQVPGANAQHVRMAAKQGDPTTKPGVVGAFCRTYDVLQAMDTFLVGLYLPTDGGRWTYAGGSTTGGAILYDDNAFLYSHHATDPCSGKLVNAFDLVRLHKFGDQDDDAKPGTPTNKLPSYTAMCAFAMQQEPVAGLLMQERYEKAVESFGSAEGSAVVEPDMSWIKRLEISATGKPAKTAHNVLVVLLNDLAIKGRIFRDTFTERIMGVAPLPWPPRNTSSGAFAWSDSDDHGLFLYMERVLSFRSEPAIRSAFVYCSEQNAINPVAKYLQGLSWDGVQRLDSLYIDYFGVEDCLFIRTITRKALVAAVARAMAEHIKFDYMTVVCGPQGIGKSTFFRKLGMDWFSDSLKTFEGKEAEELIQGKWIVEIAELQAFNRVDVNRIKQFLSKVDDQYRAAYGHNVKNQVRRSIFFGTTNDHEYLHDPTGNRRFWPVDARPKLATKSVFRDLTESEIDQIWAEAVMHLQLGELLYLSPEMEEEAERRRQAHMVRDPLEGMIEEFIQKTVPGDWLRWSLESRLIFWGGGMKYEGQLEARGRVCAIEIWRECLMERRTATKADSNRINAIMEKMPGWERSNILHMGLGYGKQRGFVRKT